MPAISYRTGDDATEPGGADLVISLDADQIAALGNEAGDLVDWFHSALFALGLLRNGHQGDWYTVIQDLDTQLIPRLEGIRAAAIRAHDNAGGSVGQLGNAMNVARSTAQTRLEVLRRSTKSTWEDWATNGGPQDRP